MSETICHRCGFETLRALDRSVGWQMVRGKARPVHGECTVHDGRSILARTTAGRLVVLRGVDDLKCEVETVIEWSWSAQPELLRQLRSKLRVG